MTIKNTCLLVTVSMLLTSACAFADGNAFTPLNFDDTAYSVPSSPATKTTTSSFSGNQGVVDVNSTVKTGNVELQSAISKIDTALENIRNEQNTCKAKYAEIDNQYRYVKDQRRNMKKQVRANDKRIKELTRAKTNLGKNVL